MAKNGADILLMANTGTDAVPVWTAVGSQRDATLNESVDGIDASSKDAAAARVDAGRYSCTISCDALYIPNDAAQNAVRTAFRSRTKMKVRMHDAGTAKMEGTVLITSREVSFPDMEESTVSLEMTLDGAWTEVVAGGI